MSREPTAKPGSCAAPPPRPCVTSKRTDPGPSLSFLAQVSHIRWRTNVVLRRVTCDSRPPVDVRHRAGSVTLSSTFPWGVRTGGGRDWYWLSCLLSSSGWTRFERCWQVPMSPRSRNGWEFTAPPFTDGSLVISVSRSQVWRIGRTARCRVRTNRRPMSKCWWRRCVASTRGGDHDGSGWSCSVAQLLGCSCRPSGPSTGS